jgi:agmatine deiminase
MAQSKESIVRIGLVQTSVSNDVAKNIKKTMSRIRDAAKRGARVICLQELYRTKYFPLDERKDVAHLAETIPGESTEALSRLAAKLNVVIVAPVFELDTDGKFYNSAAVIDADGAIAGVYRKIHIPHDPFFYEQSYFEHGNQGYRVFKTRYLNFAVLICYDQWFPEAARVVALEGADLIFYPTAIGYLKGDPLPHSDWLNAWITIQRAHAIANFVQVAVVNRVGVEGPIKFWGASFVADAFGKILKKANDEEAVLVVDVDISQNARIREGWRFNKNRRPDTYGRITEPLRRDTPKEHGYHMPAEWEPHQATWLAWPYDRVTFPKRVKKVEQLYLQIITELSRNETVNLAVRNADVQAKVAAFLKEGGVRLRRVHFEVWDYADVWFRDYGPTFVVNPRDGKLALVQWRFNAWGNKYKELLKDGHVPYFISERFGLTLFRPGIVVEGGAIDVNGAGAVLTTEQCLLNENRNPVFSKKDAERYLDEYLGATRVIWLKRGIEGDDTDGHIDNLARFVNPTTVVCAFENDAQDANHEPLRQNCEVLRSTGYDVVRLPMPPAKYDTIRGTRRRLSSSYMNFYIANGLVLVPTFQAASDDLALKTLGEVFADRTVVGIDCSDLIYGAGTLHCISQQQPKQ